MASTRNRSIAILLIVGSLSAAWRLDAAPTSGSDQTAQSRTDMPGSDKKSGSHDLKQFETKSVPPTSAAMTPSANIGTVSSPAKPSSTVTASCTSLKTCDESFRFIFSLVWRGLVVLGGACVIFLFCRQWRLNPLIIEPFDVPKDLQDMGLTGAVLSQRLADHIFALQQTARSDDGTAEQATVELPRMQVDLQLPGTPWSMGSAIRYLKQALRRRERRIVGDVVPIAKVYSIRLRSSDGRSKDVPVHFKDARGLDSALACAAEVVLLLVSPLELGAILFSSEKSKSGYEKAKKAIEEHLATKPSKAHQAAYVALAAVSKEMGDRVAMEENLELAKIASDVHLRRTFRPRLGPRYYNFLGGLARETGAPLEAVRLYRQALRMARRDVGIRSNLALAYTDMGRFRMASWFNYTAIWLKPSSSRGWRGLGFIEMRQGDYARALTFFTRAVDIAPLARWPRLNRIEALARLNPYSSRCGMELQSLLDIDPEFGPAHRTWAALFREQGDLLAAQRAAERARECSPTDAWSDTEYARICLRLGRLQEAIEAAQTALAKRPNHPDGLRALAAVRFQTGRYDEALMLLYEATKAAPWDVWSPLELSDLHRDLGRLDEALVWIKEANKRRPNYAEVYRRWAKWHVVRGQLAEAERMFKRILDVSPSDPWAHLELAELARTNANLGQAKEILSKALLSRVRRSDVLRSYARSLNFQGQFALAEKAYKEAVDEASGDANAILDISDFYWKRGRWSDAVGVLTTALERLPRKAELLRRLALYKTKLDDAAGAESAYREGIAVDTGDFRCLLDFSDFLQKSGRGSEALVQTMTAYSRQPRSADVLRKWASLLEAQGDLPGAEREYLRAMQDALPNIRVLFDLFDFYLRWGRLKDANAMLLSAEKQFFVSAESLRRWGLVLWKVGDIRGAESKFRAAISMAPIECSAHGNLAALYRELGRINEALEVVKDACLRQPYSSEFLRIWGWRLLEMGKFDEAMQKFNRAVEVAPGEVLAMLDLSIIREQKKDFNGALDWVERAFSRQPHSPEVLRRWAKLLEHSKCIDAARENFNAAKGDLFGLLDLAEFHARQGHREDAKLTFEEAYMRAPQSAEVLRRWAMVLAKFELADDANEKYSDAIDRSEFGDVRAFQAYADFLEERDRTEDALCVAEKAVNLNPRSGDALRLRAKLHRKLGNFTAAEGDWVRAADLPPFDDVSGLLELAGIYLRAGQKEESLTAVLRAHRRQPRSAKVLERWADILEHFGQDAAAAEKRKQAGLLELGVDPNVMTLTFELEEGGFLVRVSRRATDLLRRAWTRSHHANAERDNL
jgi:tetratricopeptide (TPR) repeat protein